MSADRREMWSAHETEIHNLATAEIKKNSKKKKLILTPINAVKKSKSYTT